MVTEQSGTEWGIIKR
ncbi:hypothetical protein YPPY48_0890, partial [Yersinia pestis PY-48]